MINQLHVSLFSPFHLGSFCGILKLINVDSLCKHCNYFEVLIIKMSQSSSKSKANGARKQEVEVKKVRRKKSLTTLFWTDDEVQLLLKVTGEYKANKEMENILTEMKYFLSPRSHMPSLLSSAKN